MKLSELFHTTMQERWEHSKGARTFQNKTRNILAVLGDIPVNSIQGDTLSSLVATLRAAGNGPATINLKLKILRAAMLSGYHKGQVAKVPDIQYYMEKEYNGRIRFLTKEEEQDVLANFQETDMADLVAILLDTGMRIGEALALEWRDVNLETQQIHVWENKDNLPRTIKMTRRVQEVLKMRPTESTKVFNLSYQQVVYQWRKARRALALTTDKEFVIHALRHTCASRLVQRGVPLFTVQKWLGHRDIKQTERYAHLAPEQFDTAVAALEKE